MAIQKRHVNADPLTGEPGAHPIGTSLGTVGGASAGAIIGSAAGPIGTATGAVVGAIAGGIAGAYAGKEIAEAVNPTDELAFWRAEHANLYGDEPFDRYADAYTYGYDARIRYPNKHFHEVEKDLSEQWTSKPSQNLDWTKARNAVEGSFNRTGEQYKRTLSDKPETRKTNGTQY